MKVKNVLLVGLGQLGCRHLEGLLSCNIPLEIFAFDSSLSALKSAKLKFKTQKLHTIYWHNAIPADLLSIDICIISTTSKGRQKLIKYISNKIIIQFWILEKILTQSHDELINLRNHFASQENVWINTPWRTMAIYKSLKDSIDSSSSMRLSFTGFNWGLACNSVHFLDLTSWITGESLSTIDVRGLKSPWFESKRTGFYDTTGTLKAAFSNGSVLNLTDSSVYKKWLLKIELINN